jgi:transposase
LVEQGDFMTGMIPSVGGSQARIYLYNVPVDMRRSFDGLMAIVQSEFEQDVRQGDLFLFINKRRDRIKLLWWDEDGLAIFMKRLEQGTFERPRMESDSKQLQMDRTELGLLLSGIELKSVKRRKRYQAKLAARGAE